jgi:pimeloyl-ACP methyl ester carboxylesterase
MAARTTATDGLRAPGTATLTLSGRRVRYRDEGQGTPVLLLHGIGRSLEDWIDQHERLSGHDLRVISVDLAGFGESDPLAGAYSLAALATHVESFLDELGLAEPAHVVGNSLGGAVALQLASQAPQRVRSLVAVNSAGFGREVAAMVRLLSIRPLGQLLMSRPSLGAARRLELSLFDDPTFVTDERVALGFRLARRPEGTRVFLDTAAALGSFRGAHEEWRGTLVDAVARLDVPILVVWGDHDKIFPASHLEAAGRLLPDARTHLFANTGHMPHIERADELADLVLDFWADVATKGGS